MITTRWLQNKTFMPHSTSYTGIRKVVILLHDHAEFNIKRFPASTDYPQNKQAHNSEIVLSSDSLRRMSHDLPIWIP